MLFRIAIPAIIFLWLTSTSGLAQGKDLIDLFVREAGRFAAEHEAELKALATLPSHEIGDDYTDTQLTFEPRDCSPSEQFQFARWCSARSHLGPWTKISAVIMDDGRLAYFNQEARLDHVDKSTFKKMRARVPPGGRLIAEPSLKSAFLITWGDLRLEKLTANELAIVAAGNSPKKGIIVDHLNDLTRSAKTAKPIYSLAGGLGGVWVGSLDDRGVLRVRAFSFDPSVITAPPDARGVKADQVAADETKESNKPSYVLDVPKAQRDTTVANDAARKSAEQQAADERTQQIVQEFEAKKAEDARAVDEANRNAAEALSLANKHRDRADVVSQVLNYMSYGVDEGLAQEFWWRDVDNKCIYRQTPALGAMVMVRWAQPSDKLGTFIDFNKIDRRTVRFENQNSQLGPVSVLMADRKMIVTGAGHRDIDRVERGLTLIFDSHCAGTEKAF